MAVFRLPRTPIFPHPSIAEPDGWLAVGGDLSAARLITAYAFGIFPWYNPGEQIRWYAPMPRFGMHPGELRIQKSLRATLRKDLFTVTHNQSFPQVIRACKTVDRPGQSGTWITDGIERAFTQLHKQGWAQSVEVWQAGELVGGLYGLRVGKIFCGESMFNRVSDASKIAFVHLAKQLDKEAFTFIDCQQETEHLSRFGARLYEPEIYWEIIRSNLKVLLTENGTSFPTSTSL